MFGIPSFLSWPFALPQLPSISLPDNIQRRFLSFVLKRSLGRFVKPGSLDVERIQAQISQGWVEIEGLEVDTEAINSFLADAPIRLMDGKLDKVTARVPFPNLWSDPLSLSLNHLTLDFAIASPFSKGKSPSSRSSYPTLQSPLDLAQSVTSAADDFLHDELDAYEGAELDRSIRQSIILNQNDPFAEGADDVPGSFPFSGPSSADGLTPSPTVESKTALAGLVERILARLQVKVQDVRLRLHVEDKEHGGVFELRVASVQYADESNPPTEERQETVRTVRISGLAIFALPARKPGSVDTASANRPPLSASTTRTSSMSSNSSQSVDDVAEMTMSLAVADLRQSTMMASMVSGASVYQSALSERIEEESDSENEGGDQFASAIGGSPPSSAPNDRPSLDLNSPSTVTAPASEETLLLSFGQDDVILRMRTNGQPAAERLPTSPSARSPNPVHVPPMPSLDVSSSVGIISCILTPPITTRLLTALQLITSQPPSQPKAEETGTDIKRQPRLSASLRIKGFYLAVIYDMKAALDPALPQHAAQFWSKPTITFLPYGHLKVRLEGIDASYNFKGYNPPRQHSHASSDRPGYPIRRQSSGVSFGPPPPVLDFSLGDLSIFEYLATDSAESEEDPNDTIPGGAYPVLIFDSNFTRQYDPSTIVSALPGSTSSSSRSSAKSTAMFPEFEAVDWRNSGLQKKSGASEKAWKVRVRPRGGLKGAAGSHAVQTDEGPIVKLRTELSASSPAILKLCPMHLFLDLSLVERLLPVLRHISPVVKAGRPPSGRESPIVATSPTSTRPPFVSERSSSYVLDDLDAQAATAASVSTIRATSRRSSTAVVECPLVRLDIRCPAPLARRGTWGDGAHLRSGLVTLDLHNLRATLGGGDLPATARGAVTTQDVGSVTWDRLIIFFCRVPSKTSKAILVIGPLAPDPTDLINADPLPPVVELRKSTSHITAKATSMITCRIPSVQARIEQATIGGLQFFADDITHWLDGAFGDGSAPKPKDDLKMIGSRFFGSKGSSSVSSSDEEIEEDADASVLRVLVTEVDVTLHVPRSVPADLNGSTSREWVLGLHTSDMEARIESNIAGRQETTLHLTVMDASFADISPGTTSGEVLRRTVPLTLTGHTSPLFALRFSSLTEPVSSTKETGISISCSTAVVFITKDLGWIQDLASFAKTPEGVFEDVVPSEITRIQVQLFDTSVHVSAPTQAGALVLVLGHVDLRTDIVSDAEDSILDLGAERVNLLGIDERSAASGLSVGYNDSFECWKRAGYAPLVEIALDARVVRDLTGSGEVLLDILNNQVKVTLCADSLATFAQLAGDLANLVPRDSPSTNEDPVRSPTMLEQSVNVFGSVDEEAFKRLPDFAAGLDLIEDDLPNNPDYLDDAAGRRTGNGADMFPESIQSWQEYDNPGVIGSDGVPVEVNGHTIKILLDGPIEFEDGYWDALPVLNSGDTDPQPGKIRLRLHESTVSIYLHEGYDWQRTRKLIEDEIKAVRRRLEKIRQLLASGQKADESIERANTGSVLFNSIYIGVEQRNEMDAAALIQAIDDELEGMGMGEDELATASQSSWQTLPPPGGAARSKTRLRGKRLGRSKKAQIEIGVYGLKADLDMYGPLEAIAKRLHISAKTIEILDHIKTSTWKKFLTEMKADSRGNIRETDADMLRLEMMGVRPNLPRTEEELRLKAKILPLKLHVDQDALDFLKALFGFQMPPPSASSGLGPKVQIKQNPSATKAQEPFFQHVEIFPIELKLDYKPKRVDLAALREGKTIELMNFFHFDGAEMTLRHITLSGVSGVSRLSTLLQDIWTPDVKANQLADVISGVSPIRSMVNVGSGVADLILLPIEQYRKDGRVARGVQRGTNSFVKSTAMEMMKLGARLATGTQVILERAEGVLGGKFGQDVIGEVGGVPGASGNGRQGGGGNRAVWDGDRDGDDPDVDLDPEVVDLVSRYADQPADMRQGVQAAYKSLSRNMNEAAQTILAVPMEVYERSGESGPLRAVVRAVPVAVLRPMIGASEAVSKTLLGARNSLDPSRKAELGDKYK